MGKFEKIIMSVTLLCLVFAFPWLAFFPLMIALANDGNNEN